MRGQFQVVTIHSMAIVQDFDQGFAAFFQDHSDLGRTGVQGVFDYLFYDARRTFDDLTGGDSFCN